MFKHIIKNAIISIVGGFVAAVAALILASMYVVVRGKTTEIPGLVEYAQDEHQMSIMPSDYFPLTIVICALLVFPLAFRLTSRRDRS